MKNKNIIIVIVILQMSLLQQGYAGDCEPISWRYKLLGINNSGTQYLVEALAYDRENSEKNLCGYPLETCDITTVDALYTEVYGMLPKQIAQQEWEQGIKKLYDRWTVDDYMQAKSKNAISTFDEVKRTIGKSIYLCTATKQCQVHDVYKPKIIRKYVPLVECTEKKQSQKVIEHIAQIKTKKNIIPVDTSTPLSWALIISQIL